MNRIQVVHGVEPVVFGPRAHEVGQHWAAALLPEDQKRSDQLLVVAPGLLTSPGMPRDVAHDFAEMTGMDTVAYRTAYGQLADPMWQVPGRAALIADKVIARQRSERPGTYQDKINLVTQSAGGILAARFVEEGGVDAYVGLSTVGLTVRDRLSADVVEELDAMVPEEQAETIYELTDLLGQTGEQRTAATTQGFIRNCFRESWGMVKGREVKPNLSANRGFTLDVLPNLRRSAAKRELPESRVPDWLRYSRIAEAFRLASNADTWRGLQIAQANGTKVGGVFGTEDPIVSIQDVRRAKPRFDAYEEVEGVGHPFMTSRRAQLTNQAAARMVVSLAG